MKTRVTVTLDPKVHKRAKLLARRQKASVSGLIEKLLSEQSGSDDSIVENMVGSASLKQARKGDARQTKLMEKYLRS